MPRKTLVRRAAVRAVDLRFNEAAARCRGKLVPGLVGVGGGTRFNEAAARCRGKRGGGSANAWTSCASFNEAAARCRGKHPLRGLAERRRARAASMRPRPDAAENGIETIRAAIGRRPLQ